MINNNIYEMNITPSDKDLINLAQNLDCYDYIPGIEDEEDLGYYYVDEMGALEIPETLTNYFNYEAYGRGHID